MITLVRLQNPHRGPTHGIRAPGSKEFVDAMHEVPGMVFDKPRKIWLGYEDAIVLAFEALAHRGFTVPPFNPDPPGPLPSVVLPVAYAGLRDYQKSGTNFLVANASTGALIADDLGLGKSAQALRAVRAYRRPTLVICPSIARGVWGGANNEVAKWWPAAASDMRVLEGVMDMPFRLKKKSGDYVKQGEIFPWRTAKAWIEHNAKRDVTLIPEVVQLPSRLITIIHYDILYAWAPHLLETCETIIFDEIHMLVGRWRESQRAGPVGPRRSKAAMLLSQHAHQVIGLSGTPATGVSVSMYNSLNTLSPGRFGNYYAFTRRYCGGHLEQVTPEIKAWKADGVTNADELRRRMSWFMIRRTKAEVAQELPLRTRQIIEVAVPPRRAMGVTGAIKSEAAVRRALELAALGKIPFAIDLAKGHVAAGNKAIVFTRLRKTAEMIAGGLKAAGVLDATFIHGGMDFNRRQQQIDKEPSVLVATMDSCAGAISLVFAAVAVYAELHVSPHIIIQTEGRLHRIGQQRSVLYQFLIAPGTLDDLLRDRIITKLDAFEKNIGVLEHNLASDLGGKSEEEVIMGLAQRLSEAS